MPCNRKSGSNLDTRFWAWPWMVRVAKSTVPSRLSKRRPGIHSDHDPRLDGTAICGLHWPFRKERRMAEHVLCTVVHRACDGPYRECRPSRQNAVPGEASKQTRINAGRKARLSIRRHAMLSG
jgi:hypothetical protein